MTLYEYFLELPLGSRSKLAGLLDITPYYLSRLIYKKSKPSPYLAIQIEKMTEGSVKRHELLPEIFKE